MKLAVYSLVPAVAVIAALASSSLTPRPGPGAVLEMHKQLFAAIDAGDEARAVTFLDPAKEGGWPDGEGGGLGRPTLMLTAADGMPASANGAEEARALLAKIARASRDGGPEWSTKIVTSRSDCHSSELSYATFEFERTRGVKGGTQRWRSTSLVRHTEGGGWKLFHWHVSPADEATAQLVSAVGKKR